MTTGKTIALTRRIFVGKVKSLLLNIVFSLVITFLRRIKCLLISWLQSPSAVILEPPKKSDTVSTVYPSISHEVMGPDAMIFVFWMLSIKPTFSLSSFTFIKRLLSSSRFEVKKSFIIEGNISGQAMKYCLRGAFLKSYLVLGQCYRTHGSSQ